MPHQHHTPLVFEEDALFLSQCEAWTANATGKVTNTTPQDVMELAHWFYRGQAIAKRPLFEARMSPEQGVKVGTSSISPCCALLPRTMPHASLFKAICAQCGCLLYGGSSALTNIFYGPPMPRA